jgi:hypothetical protein
VDFVFVCLRPVLCADENACFTAAQHHKGYSMSASGAHSLAQSLALFVAPLVGFSDEFAAGFARDRAEAASLLPPLGYRRKT